MDTDGDSGHGPDDACAGPPAALHLLTVPAEPQRLPALRRALTDWAERAGMTADQVEALTLASYEALANAAAHAYPDGAGVLDVYATYLPDSPRVEITVADHGVWRPAPTDRGGLGGRGLILIRSLADQADVTTDASGTTVCMTWYLEHAPAEVRRPT